MPKNIEYWYRSTFWHLLSLIEIIHFSIDDAFRVEAPALGDEPAGQEDDSANPQDHDSPQIIYERVQARRDLASPWDDPTSPRNNDASRESSPPEIVDERVMVTRRESSRMEARLLHSSILSRSS